MLYMCVCVWVYVYVYIYIFNEETFYLNFHHHIVTHTVMSSPQDPNMTMYIVL